MSVAEYLLDRGKKVELVTQQQFVGARVGGSTWNRLTIDLNRKGAVLTPSTVVERVEGSTVYLVDVYGGREFVRRDVDSVVVVGDSVVDDALLRRLQNDGRRVIAAGDCVAPRLLEMAIVEGHRAGRDV
jgi:hypothetical protein